MSSVAPGAASADVSADVTADGGLPIFERGFAYSSIEPNPEPGKLGVLTFTVPGGVSAMGARLPLLASGATYSLQAYARNLAGTGLSGVQTFTTLGGCGLSIDTSLTNGLLGSPYSVTLSLSGGSGPYTFSYLGLPPGITGTGDTVAGTPSAAGTYSVDVTAVETSTGCFATANYTVIIGTAVAAGGVVISEFRTYGPGGIYDEYVEVGNRTAADIVVASTDGSGGWSIGIFDGTSRQSVALIADGTVIKKGGHWLAAGAAFSLSSLGAFVTPDALISNVYDIADDAGVGLFATGDAGNYSPATLLDAAGGVSETDSLFWEGTPLAAVVDPSNPKAQTAWVRRLSSSAMLSDVNDNARDFVFVAGDAGHYGPLAPGGVDAVLGGPNPEGTSSLHDVLQGELPSTLIDPTQGENRSPNREVARELNFPYPLAVEYRRAFTNNTGKEITALAFKVVNVTTLNSRPTLAVQADLRVVEARSRSLEAPIGSNNFVDLLPTNLEDIPPYFAPYSMYPLTYDECGDGCYVHHGGHNSRVLVPFASRLGLRGARGPGLLASGKSSLGGFAPSETIAVNFRTFVYSPGYYLWVVVPQVSYLSPSPPCCLGIRK